MRTIAVSASVAAWALLGLVVSSGVEAAPTKTIFQFQSDGMTGSGPTTGLLKGQGNIFYGTTSNGGRFGLGTVFRITAAGAHEVLYAFNNDDGDFPNGALVADANGLLYGTTARGGRFRKGTVFRYSIATGTLTILYHFPGGLRGDSPAGPLALDQSGNIYGLANGGGASGNGVIFKIAPDRTQSILRSFDGTNGSNPGLSGLTIDSEGVLYGTTRFGGSSGQGNVFKFTPDRQLKVLYSFFFEGPNGTQPFAGVIRDAAGNLYGTTENGGPGKKGTVFKLAPSGVMTRLYSFNGTNGANPQSRLVMDSEGNLYGNTVGGASCCGTVFKVTPGSQGSTLHRFPGTPGGEFPIGGPQAFDSNGNLYGTTAQGGEFSRGTVYRVFLR